ncbi:hypothetical protein KSP39_PZI012650 [Platanthera zijinensis]|uniref:Uncharacterized protein n=1 Tax=Platanthera zijinensis TaxID=2320716 RepID=A0AAP0BF65_9ASPA
MLQILAESTATCWHSSQASISATTSGSSAHFGLSPERDFLWMDGKGLDLEYEAAGDSPWRACSSPARRAESFSFFGQSRARCGPPPMKHPESAFKGFPDCW